MNRLKRHAAAVLGATLAIVALAVSRPEPGYSQGPISKDVVVVNTPQQPVPVTVAGAPSVNVTNTSANPVPVTVGSLPLAPTKASELVTVVGSGTPTTCGSIGNGFELTTLITYGQYQGPGSFVIPANRVFVVTGWQWFVADDVQAGGFDTVFLGSGGVVLATGVTPLNASGNGGSSQTLPGPVPLRPGRPLCIATSAPFSQGSATVYGFFADDR
jgi:hypothetical protein